MCTSDRVKLVTTGKQSPITVFIIQNSKKRLIGRYQTVSESLAEVLVNRALGFDARAYNSNGLEIWAKE